jgi:hypothetical protein
MMTSPGKIPLKLVNPGILRVTQSIRIVANGGSAACKIGPRPDSIGTDRCGCMTGPDVKSHEVRSVASRSRCIIIIFDKLFIHHLESNSLYSILHINETKPTRNGTWALRSSVVSLFEIPKCTAEK